MVVISIHWIFVLVDFSLTSLLPELTLFSPFLRKPASPKSDDTFRVTLTHDTEVYNAPTGSLVLLSVCESLTGLISRYSPAVTTPASTCFFFFLLY